MWEACFCSDWVMFGATTHRHVVPEPSQTFQNIRFFKQYDTNANGVLEYAEVERLANDLFLTLGISLEEGRLKECFLAHQQFGVFVLQDLGWNLKHVDHDMFSEKAMTD